MCLKLIMFFFSFCGWCADGDKSDSSLCPDLFKRNFADACEFELELPCSEESRKRPFSQKFQKILIKKRCIRGPISEAECETRQDQICKEILTYLRGCGAKPCGERVLKDLVGGIDQGIPVSLPIVLLRAEGHNIVHDKVQKTYVLSKAQRVLKAGSFEKELWSMLCDPELYEVPAVHHLALHLSDLGYNPVWKRVRCMVAIKLYSSCCDEKRLYATERVRRGVWTVLLQEGFIRDCTYYNNHPSVRGGVTPRDVAFIRQCWAVYQEVFFGYVGGVTKVEMNLKDYLQGHPEGVTKSQISRHLSPLNQKNFCVWSHINALMCNGYAQFISYKDDKFYWTLDEPHVPFKKGEVFEDLYQIVENECRQRVVAHRLHKLGHFNCSYILVERMLQILGVAGIKPFSNSCFCAYFRELQSNQKCLGDFKKRVRYALEFMQGVDENVFQAVRKRTHVDFEKVMCVDHWDHMDVIYDHLREPPPKSARMMCVSASAQDIDLCDSEWFFPEIPMPGLVGFDVLNEAGHAVTSDVYELN